ncbi:MAG: hypothetical protein HOU81_26210 [Hamadaea sp.]|uniref:hypothetical protein n=1 Tax=Hamadaea sp. TaxID=2024425 RepID=UPI0017F166CD|nr:hypothetical protein [Hamadaea sp.]NUR74319.1 hypothetical protein [Hamadaea sp.]NUT22313.1 hypothetical protein [Hamadaea sp.]
MTILTLPPTDWARIAISGPTEEQRPATVLLVYRLWLVAFILKMLGSTWDMSWHFKWLRDDLAPPHLLNTVGTVLAVALAIFQVRTGVGVDKRARNLIVAGTGLFLLAIPIDVLNHRINGLDITAWSPSHALLYIGTALMILGVAHGFGISTAPGRVRTVGLSLAWFFFLENVLFPSQHQEYGVLSLKAYLAGTPYAEPILLKFAADQIGRPVDTIAITNFTLPVDSWVYPLWLVGAAMLTLVAARIFVGARWTATILTAAYLAYRCVVWGLLYGTGFPPSAVPFALLAGAAAVDVAFLVGALSGAERTLPGRVGVAVVGAMLTASALGAGLYAQAELAAPPVRYAVLPLAALALAAGWIALTVRRAPVSESAEG